jgi:UDP-N-acetylmuramate dehydrogenase
MLDGMRIEENVPLAPLTTLGIGGPARWLARITDEDSLAGAVAFARERDLPLLVLGGGSNLLVADEGFPGLVARVEIAGVGYEPANGAVEATCGAGEEWDALVERAVSRELAGIECLSGIPGRVGATPIQNVGAYGQEVAETIARVRAYDLESGRFVEFTAAECGFGYRDSRFKREDRGRYIVTSVTFRLAPGGEAAVRYPELERALGEGRRALAEVRKAVLAIRRRKSMVLDPEDPDARSAGSFFVNPIVPDDVADRIAASHADPMPRYTAPGGAKLSAAWLIERAGLSRGYRKGNAGISSKHTLAIVNRGGATASEVVALAREVRDRVRDRFGVTLTPEPVFVGLSLDDSRG